MQHDYIFWSSLNANNLIIHIDQFIICRLSCYRINQNESVSITNIQIAHRCKLLLKLFMIKCYITLHYTLPIQPYRELRQRIDHHRHRNAWNIDKVAIHTYYTHCRIAVFNSWTITLSEYSIYKLNRLKK
jgi:hypothetical protein